MPMPRFILLAFIALVVGGIFVATSLLSSNSEPDLGEVVVVTPVGTRQPTTPSPGSSPPVTPAPTGQPGPSAATIPPPSEAVPVPGCAPLAGDDNCDDDVDDDLDDYLDDDD